MLHLLGKAVTSDQLSGNWTSYLAPLLAKLAAYGVAPVSLPLLHSYRKNKSECVRIEDVTSDVVVFSKGVPQGLVLGPL